MANRRQFIQSGLALTAASLPAVVAWPSEATQHGAKLTLERFVFDRRFAAGRGLAAQAARRGLRVAPFAGDLTRLWYRDLDCAWRQAPMALGGLTTQGGLFVLETLAADRGMRVVYRGLHGVPRQGRVEHRLRGAPTLLARLGAPDAPWPMQIAAVLDFPLAESPAAEKTLTTTAEPGTRRDATLVSWIIAPRAIAAARV